MFGRLMRAAIYIIGLSYSFSVIANAEAGVVAFALHRVEATGFVFDRFHCQVGRIRIDFAGNREFPLGSPWQSESKVLPEKN